MSRDLEIALRTPLEDLVPGATLDSRTGDTPSHRKQKQMRAPPNVLITTPESLGLMLSYPAGAKVFANLRFVIVDEWHELLDSKRGSQLVLCLSRLRSLAPQHQRWGLTATVANPNEAMYHLCGDNQGCLVQAQLHRPIELETLVPPRIEELPWAGHYGLSQLRYVAERLDPSIPALIFTNTRAQAETWFEALRIVRADLAPSMALHHGSLDKEERERVESGLKSGELSFAVCTSSLDLGVDFSAIEAVFQIGSIKRISRLIQRAGRAGHRPGASCRVICVPTHALQLLEIGAARQAIEQGTVEPVVVAHQPLDVLCQHLVSWALAGGFTTDQALAEIRRAPAYADLSEQQLNWVLNLLERGGECLQAYPDYHRLTHHNGRWVVENSRVARRHRMSIGTIVSTAQVSVRFVNGRRLGSIEESFVARLKPGERFQFAGKTVQFVRLHDMVCQVKSARTQKAQIPQWGGYRLPLSDTLSKQLRNLLHHVDQPERLIAAPILAAQQRLSGLPRPEQVLFEWIHDREGHHLCIYPFAGRLAHEGLAAVLAWRLTQDCRATFSTASNDYGLELVTQTDQDWADLVPKALDGLVLEKAIFNALNLGELARREFREVARISGLVFEGYPGAGKSHRQIQASSGLLYDVFTQHDPDNLMLIQARQQVLEKQFEFQRLQLAVSDLHNREWLKTQPAKHTPFSLPLVIERIQDTQSSESLEQRVQKMVGQWS